MNHNYKLALSAALDELGMNNTELYDLTIKWEDGFYYICFCTDWQRVECYVEAESLEVLGLNLEPALRSSSGSLDYIQTGTVA